MELRFNRNHGKWFVNDVLRAIRRYGLIGRGDRVAVALSGGKDSTLLLYVLRYLQRFSHLRFHLSALHVKAFADDDPAPLRDLCRRLQVEYHETTLDWEPARASGATIPETGRDARDTVPVQSGCATVGEATPHRATGPDSLTDRDATGEEDNRETPLSRQAPDEGDGTTTGRGQKAEEAGMNENGRQQTPGGLDEAPITDRQPATPGAKEAPGRATDAGEDFSAGPDAQAVPAAAGRTICALCSRLKRGAMARLCVEHGITRLAYGHHGTDVAETFLMNLFETKKLGSFRPRIDPGEGRPEGTPAGREGPRETPVAGSSDGVSPAGPRRASRRPAAATAHGPASHRSPEPGGGPAANPTPAPPQEPAAAPATAASHNPPTSPRATPSPAPTRTPATTPDADPSPTPAPRPPQIIRPLVLLDERTVAAVHRHLGLPVTGFRCPYAPLNRRALYKSVLADLEQRLGLPGLPRRIVDALAHADPGNLWEALRKERATGPTHDDGTT